MKPASVTSTCLAVIGSLLLSTLSGMVAAQDAPAATILVSGTRWGTSMCYIGATEGNARFDIDDRVSHGSRTEAQTMPR